MQLTLEQTATRLGKSQRQILYMIRQNQLPAKKIAGRWFIDTADLPLSENQRRSGERKQRQLKAAVEEALDIADDDPKPRYSVRDLKAFQVALPLYRKICEELTASHPAAQGLRRVLEHLCRGCHRYRLYLDIRRYFPSIPHPTLCQLLFRWLWDERTRRLIRLLLQSGGELYRTSLAGQALEAAMLHASSAAIGSRAGL
jgi:hypothetical protein